MNRVVVINGSPKRGSSTSGRLIGELERIMGRELEVHHALSLLVSEDDSYGSVLQADALVVVFPLYVDALPTHLVRLFKKMEAAIQASEHKPRLYAVCVCGFIEGEHTKTALRIMRNFADRAGLSWGYGVGVGGGGFVVEVKDMAKGPTSRVHRALCALAGEIEAPTSGAQDDVFVQPSMPRIAYTLAANMGWRMTAKRNGAKDQLKQVYGRR